MRIGNIYPSLQGRCFLQIGQHPFAKGLMHSYGHCKLFWAGSSETPAGLNVEGASVGLTVQRDRAEFRA